MRLRTHALIPWLTFTAVRATPPELVDWRCEESRLHDGLSDLLLPGDAASCTAIIPAKLNRANTLLRASLIFYI
jgi:hypothetical protein